MRRKQFTGAALVAGGAYYMVRTHEPLSGTGTRAIAPTPERATPTPVPAAPEPSAAPQTDARADENTLSTLLHHAQTGGGKIIDAVQAGAPWVQQHGKWFLLAAVLILAAGYTIDAIRKAAPQDPQRAFTKAQRAEGFERAGGRCEMNGFLWFRCNGPAEHADHHYPWSRGGASDMQNLLASCAPCNLSKGARVPSRANRRAIERRRRKYFPAGVPVFVGSRVPKRPPVAVDPNGPLTYH